MKRLLLLGTIGVLLYSCQQGISPVAHFNPENLASQQVSINTNRDTVVQLQGGTALRIPAHALEGEHGDTVVLTVKEALTITDMINAGLTTKSGDKMLASGGMIYIDANARILEPIQVTMSPEYIDPDMQLFKGEVTASGINWINPKGIKISKDTLAIVRGQHIYQRYCASCHQIDTGTMAPPLLGAIDRWRNDTNNLFYYIRFAQDLVSDQYTCCLRRKYNTQMSRHNQLDEDSLKEIFTYVREEGMKKYGGVPARFKISDCDCAWDYQPIADSLAFANTEYTKNLVAGVAYDRYDDDGGDHLDFSNYAESNGATTSRSSKPQPVTPVPPPVFGNNYTFLINNFGWFNIDKFVNDKTGILKVHLKGVPYSSISVLLVIPGDKVMTDGYFINGYFYFKEEDGSLPLPVNKQCHIIAMGVKDKIPVFGMTSFLSSASQDIAVNMQMSNEKAINAIISAFSDKEKKRIDTTKQTIKTFNDNCKCSTRISVK
ncbi:MAG: cytochrome [Bacteroidetes bacterium]|nr:cytochrome [Bacteroidota bacterium]